MIGQTIGSYKILEKLGSGGMGDVYKAEDTKLERTVALKFLSSDTIDDEEVKQRLIREAQASASLDHPNICQVYGIHEENGETFIAMAYIDGPSLADKIKERPLPLEEALRIAIQIAEGLQEAHEKGIVHRDIKPHNVMLTAKGQVKIMDFGLAAVAGRSKLTKTGTTLGTPAYMAPEQLEGGEVDRRADIWALGCVLYEMFTQRTPFAADYEQAIAYGILNEEPEPVTALRSGLPTEMDRVIAKALAKDSDQRYQHADELAVDLRQVHGESGSSRALSSRTQVERRAPSWRQLAVVAALLVVTSVGLTLWMMRPPAENEQRVLRRLTTDSGLSGWPELSPNGDLFAYASDRARRGDLDVWVRQVSGGEPIRLTDDPADDYEPSFSADGGQIAFRSERGQGGVYLVPSLGGEARLIAEGGRRPRFSPDGEWIAFWRGSLNGDSGKSYIMPAAGGPERGVQPEFYGTRDPTWSPDGKHILFSGFQEPPSGPSAQSPWWVTALEGGPAALTGSLEIFRSHGFAFPLLGGTPAQSPADWTNDGVAFHARIGDSTNVWQVRFSPRDWQVQGQPERLTSGIGYEVHPRRAGDGRIVLTNLSLNEDIWGLPMAGNEGKTAGELRRITQDLGADRYPDISSDGRKVAFYSDRTGAGEIWIKDLDARREKQLTFDSPQMARPVISPDGTQVAYAVGEEAIRSVYVVSAAGGVGRKVCEDCGWVDDWHPNDRWILFEKSVMRAGGNDVALYLLDISTGNQTRILDEPGRRFHDVRFSPDGQWVVTGATGGPRQILLASFRGEQEIPLSEWISVSEDHRVQQPIWSPDGNLIYFESDRDGFRCIYAQPLEPLTKKPRGSPFAVYHFHQAARSLLQTNPGSVSPSLGGGLLVFGMNETLGNIWISEPAPGKRQ